ncbi:MAG: sigma-54-dependent Fis family transcriptional regulator [Bacteroidetes bacterium]|nr:sigma-54-dependent Fis family transcriptional regulator [Bacteroidota bacterium]
MNRKTGNILIVDDNVQILNSLSILLKPEFETITTIKKLDNIHSLLQIENFDVIMLDMNFKAGVNTGNEGIFWLKEILKLDSQAVVLMITAYGDIELAVKAIKEGATDFIPKPWDADKLIITLRSAVELRRTRLELVRLRSRHRQINEELNSQYKLIRGTSPAMEAVYKTIDKVAVTNANILILGENGTGKELIAREIHRKSQRSAEIFLGVDLGSLSETLFESEIFGHVKGSFTDAREDRAGRFETASGGTLFLDEIGNLSMAMQSKLLTVLQNRQITRLGSVKPVPVDIRLITATNKPISQMVKENLFREDLLYRINTIQILLPPLRERQEDIPVLAQHFLNHHAGKYGKGKLTFHKEALTSIKTYSWPGNIRELDHTIEKAVILSESDIIQPSDLFLKDKPANIYDITAPRTLLEVERMAIENVLKQCSGNYSKAAQILGISRTTLYSKMEKYHWTPHSKNLLISKQCITVITLQSFYGSFLSPSPVFTDLVFYRNIPTSYYPVVSFFC